MKCVTSPFQSTKSMLKRTARSLTYLPIVVFVIIPFIFDEVNSYLILICLPLSFVFVSISSKLDPYLLKSQISFHKNYFFQLLHGLN